MDGWGDAKPEAKSERINGLIEKHVIEWDLTHKGKVLPITGDVLERLKQPFVDRLFNIITYSDKSDEETKKRLKQREDSAKN